MRFASTIIIGLFILYSFALNAVHLEKCELKKYIGDWYGELEYQSGTTYLMHLQVNKVDDCQLEGIITWPDYFNSQTMIIGSVEDEHLELKETTLTRGIFMDLNESIFSLSLAENGMLEGMAMSGGENVASIKFTSSKSLSENEIEQINTRYAASAETYGFTEVGEKSQESFEQIYSEYVETNGDGNLPFGIEVDGLAFFENLEIPLQFLISPHGQLYMKMRIQNLEMIMVKTDSMNWTYDPMKDQVSVSEGSGTNDYMRAFSGGMYSLDTVDANRITVFEAKVNDIAAYRVLYSDKSTVPQKAFYIDKKTNLLIREETSQKVIHYEGYSKILGMWLPAQMMQYEIHQKVGKFKFDEYKKVDDIDESIFEIPENLIDKVIKPSTNRSSIIDEAKLAFESQNYSQSIELYTSAIEWNPTDAGLYYKRASVGFHSMALVYSSID